jgi:hypothetical protein
MNIIHAGIFCKMDWIHSDPDLFLPDEYSCIPDSNLEETNLILQKSLRTSWSRHCVPTFFASKLNVGRICINSFNLSLLISVRCSWWLLITVRAKSINKSGFCLFVWKLWKKGTLLVLQTVIARFGFICCFCRIVVNCVLSQL